MLKPVQMAELKALVNERSQHLEAGNSEAAQKLQQQINELKEQFKELESGEGDGTRC
jgi:DNA-binding transcriptional MerR regulator